MVAARSLFAVALMAFAGCVEFVAEPEGDAAQTAPSRPPPDTPEVVASPSLPSLPALTATSSSATASSTTSTAAQPDADACHVHKGRDVRSTTPDVTAQTRPATAATLWAQAEDRVQVFAKLDPGAFAILVEPRWAEAQAWIALGEPETNGNAGWQQPERREVDGAAFLGLLRDVHCPEVVDALAARLPADLAVHLRVLRPGASYDKMQLAWDGEVPADGTWLLVAAGVPLVDVVLGGGRVDRPWNEESEWDLGAAGASFRWDFMTVGGDAVCFDDATGGDHHARCRDPTTTRPLQAFSDGGASRLKAAYDALAAGAVPLATCRGAPCTRWAERLQDVRVETTSDTATLSWKDVAGLPEHLWVTFLDEGSTMNRGKVFCYCWSTPARQDGRWVTTLGGLAGDAVLGFDIAYGNPATALYSGTLRTQPAPLGFGPVSIEGSATSVWFDFEATGSGPLRATGHWSSAGAGVQGQTSTEPSPQGRFQFGVWMTDGDVLSSGTYEAYVVLVDERGGRVESPRETFVVP